MSSDYFLWGKWDNQQLSQGVLTHLVPWLVWCACAVQRPFCLWEGAWGALPARLLHYHSLSKTLTWHQGAMSQGRLLHPWQKYRCRGWLVPPGWLLPSQQGLQESLQGQPSSLRFGADGNSAGQRCYWKAAFQFSPSFPKHSPVLLWVLGKTLGQFLAAVWPTGAVGTSVGIGLLMTSWKSTRR